MSPTTVELALLRETTQALLESLELDAFLFELEPGEADEWALRVECAMEEGWESTRLPFPRGAVMAARQDRIQARELLASWGTRLRGCRRM